jgi:prevent-host-death family protein
MPAANLADMDPRLIELIEAAVRGEEVVIARDGVPVAKLVPVGPRWRREPGRFEGEIVELDPDWWKPDDELTRLFEDGDLFPDPPLARP